MPRIISTCINRGWKAATDPLDECAGTCYAKKMKDEIMAIIPEMPLTPENAYEHAMRIIEQKWLDAGVTQEEIDQSEEFTDIFDRLVGSGYAREIIYAAWDADYTGYDNPALALYLRLLAIAERALPATDPMLSQILFSLAKQYQASGNPAAAEPLYARALTLREQTFGIQHPLTIQAREAYTALLCAANRCDEADKLQTMLVPA